MSDFSAREAIMVIGLTLVIVGSVFGALLQSNIWSGPGATTIISDTQDPQINEQASTSGNLPTGDGYPTLLCFVDENLEMDHVTAEIKEKDWLGRYTNTVQSIELDYVGKTTDTTYKYKGSITESLEVNQEYKVFYKAWDKVGRTDEYSAVFQLIQLDGTVWVNGIEITDTDQTIYLQDHIISVEAEVNQDTEDIDKVRLMLNGDEVDVFEYRYSSKDYFTSYTLPKDGSYDLIVQVLAVGGDEIRLASFNVSMNSTGNPRLIVGAVIGLLAVSAGLIYLQKREG